MDGWELEQDGQSIRVVPDRALFPAWDSLLEFKLRRRFVIDLDAVLNHLELKQSTSKLLLVTRLETGRGLLSTILDQQELIRGDSSIEVVVSPDSGRLSRDLSLVSSIVVGDVADSVDELSPSILGARVWQSQWSAKLEGGRARLPIEATSFSRDMPSLGSPRALFYVTVGDDPSLEFEQAVCVYINNDYPQFVIAVQQGERTATAMLWDGVLRQLVSWGLTSAFMQPDEPWPDESLGEQVRSWMQAIFPGDAPHSIAESRVENPGVFEARIQSWTNAGSFWSEVTISGH